MTFDDDFLQLEFDGGIRRPTLQSLGLEWPPPQRLRVYGFDMIQISCSQLTDEDRKKTGYVVRGARYRPAPAVDE